MKKATVLLRESPHYRREAFESGFKRLGFELVKSNHAPRPGDALCLWNLQGAGEKEAERYRKAGAAVIIVENAYVGSPGVQQSYAVSRDGHCGAGRFPADPKDASRWQALGISCKPWRKDGRHILVAGQRSIGSREMASPHMWHQKVAQKLQALTKRPIKIRTHPGANDRGAPLEHDLKDAWAVVVWSSTVGVKALIAGVPVFYAAPHWICAGAALPFSRFGMFAESPMCDDAARETALRRMAQGQWHYSEIATGEPLKGVLEC